MQKEKSYQSKAVAVWVVTGVIMLLIQVLLGGITRLTGSGLSITEWNVITGFVPPLSEQQWLIEFEKYKQTPQYHLLNGGFSLHDFKFIFFWEWFHRFWARLVGIVFVVGFIYLLIKKRLKPNMIRPLLILFFLGAMQGAIGWIMVASGLSGDAIYVKPTRLALHFVFALGLIAYASWFSEQLMVPASETKTYPGVHSLAKWMVACIFLQLAFGALMAGHKAAAIAPTWPTINGDWIPENLFRDKPLLLNIIDNSITIHFIHRGLAYLLLILTLIFTARIFRSTQITSYIRNTRWLPLTIVLLQVLLGIGAVLSSPGIVANKWGGFDWLALLHQLLGMCFLLCMIWMVYLTRSRAERLM